MKATKSMIELRIQELGKDILYDVNHYIAREYREFDDGCIRLINMAIEDIEKYLAELKILKDEWKTAPNRME